MSRDELDAAIEAHQLDGLYVRRMVERTSGCDWQEIDGDSHALAMANEMVTFMVNWQEANGGLPEEERV